MNKGFVKEFISYIYAVLIIIIFWQMLHLYVGEEMVPSISQTFKAFINLANTDFYMHILYSFYRISVSVLISIIIGVPTGIILGTNKLAKRILSPVIYLIYPIPKIAFLPIFMVLFGIGDRSKIILMVTIIVFQIIIATRDAVLQIDKTILISAKIMNFNKFDLLCHVILPSIAPKLFSAIRISIGISISALFFSENYATKYGIGYFIMNSWSMVDYKEMFVGVIALSLMSLVIYKFIDLLEKRLCAWSFKENI
ncbi:ABC transporter permease [Clostridium sardiniense]|uniref:ABC transporter permease n=1 Tax=Clostridium sardiniense TaxID=29369 RepID=UPI003D34B6B1